MPATSRGKTPRDLLQMRTSTDKIQDTHETPDGVTFVPGGDASESPRSEATSVADSFRRPSGWAWNPVQRISSMELDCLRSPSCLNP